MLFQVHFYLGKSKLLTTAVLLMVITTVYSFTCPLESTSSDAPKALNKETASMPTEKEEPKTTHKTDQTVLKTVKKSDDVCKEKIVYSLDFAQKTDDDARKWLTDKGFKFESDAKSQSKLSLAFANDSLVLNAKKQLFGLIINGNLHLDGAKKISITWGVDKHPKGASYENGINNEAIMVYVYFGNKKLSSGNWFIPDSPYFIGLYLGETDKINKPFTGNHFEEGGRFICLANPKSGEIITSKFDLDKAFKECFGKDKKVPFISGMALEVETSSTGPSKGVIKKIDFLR
jgi:hypothetical protein